MWGVKSSIFSEYLFKKDEIDLGIFLIVDSICFFRESKNLRTSYILSILLNSSSIFSLMMTSEITA